MNITLTFDPNDDDQLLETYGFIGIVLGAEDLEATRLAILRAGRKDLPSSSMTLEE